MTRPHPTTERGTYIGLSRTAAADMNAPSGTLARAQDEGLPVRARNDEAEDAAGGGQGFTAQASAFVTASGAGEAVPAYDPASAPDGRLILPPGWRLSADGDRLSPRRA
jgi:hypothetical protein